ncbi:prepilin peptidase [Yoonia sp. 2307UL14-13]|uniref:prepilin peptidase n=1 Tax=Yoonia sp. 2307UL14-13 TaxID=3126506 RepID=UPI0030A23A1F
MLAQYAPFVMTAILVVAVFIELRTGKIPNWLTLAPFVLFIAVAATLPDRSVLLWQLGFAAAVFAGGLMLFAFAGFGAGAVKLMSGLALFIPLTKVIWAIGLFVGLLFVVAIVLAQFRRHPKEDSDWHVLRTKSLPISLPLAIMGAMVFFVV